MKLKPTPSTSIAAPPLTDGRARIVTKHVLGEVGIWILIFGDLTVFCVAFVAFLVVRAHQPALFAHERRAVNVWIGFIDAIVLMTSSVFLVWALHNLRHSLLRHELGYLPITMILGIVFLTNKAVEYSRLVGTNRTPGANMYFNYFYALTGVHAVHIIIGLTVLTHLWLTVVARKPMTVPVAENSCCYWHFVDLLWLLIFPLHYLVA